MLWPRVLSAAHDPELNLSPSFDAAKIRAILLDIEGATTPIDFVFKTLFPYAAANTAPFLERRSGDTEIKKIIEDLRRHHAADSANNAELAPWLETTARDNCASAANYVRWLISHDSKITPLKTLQGKIWEEGYLCGELKGEVYPDVAPALARWRSRGLRIAIFSSGSVLAQRLLFKHSTAGDLSPHLEAYFDTTTGPKREPASYRKIASALQLAPEQILFVSDVIPELDAARAAGMATLQSMRPGVPPTPSSPHPVIQSFDALLP